MLNKIHKKVKESLSNSYFGRKLKLDKKIDIDEFQLENDKDKIEAKAPLERSTTLKRKGSKKRLDLSKRR